MLMDDKSVDPVRGLEMSEIIEKLRQHGYDELVDVLLDQESDCYTKKGRLNKSATTRRMGWKNKQLEDALKAMRELLKEEFDLDEVQPSST